MSLSCAFELLTTTTTCLDDLNKRNPYMYKCAGTIYLHVVRYYPFYTAPHTDWLCVAIMTWGVMCVGEPLYFRLRALHMWLRDRARCVIVFTSESIFNFVVFLYGLEQCVYVSRFLKYTFTRKTKTNSNEIIFLSCSKRHLPNTLPSVYIQHIVLYKRTGITLSQQKKKKSLLKCDDSFATYVRFDNWI